MFDKFYLWRNGLRSKKSAAGMRQIMIYIGLTISIKLSVQTNFYRPCQQDRRFSTTLLLSQEVFNIFSYSYSVVILVNSPYQEIAYKQIIYPSLLCHPVFCYILFRVKMVKLVTRQMHASSEIFKRTLTSGQIIRRLVT